MVALYFFLIFPPYTFFTTRLTSTSAPAMFAIPASLRFRKGINNRPALSVYAKQCSHFSSFASSTIKTASSAHIGSSPFKTFRSYNPNYMTCCFKTLRLAKGAILKPDLKYFINCCIMWHINHRVEQSVKFCELN